MITYGNVIGRFVFTTVDGPDAGTEWDTTPLKGSVTFAPSTDVLLTNLDGVPTTIKIAPVTANLNESGEISAELISTDNTLINPVNFTYNVSFNLSLGDKFLRHNAYNIAVPANGIVDLTNVVPLTESEGQMITKGQDGIGVQSVTTVDTNLVFTMSDGSTLTSPLPVISGDGTVGTAGKGIESVALEGTTQMVFTYTDGTKSAPLTLPVGPAGAIGPAGPQGLQGMSGPSGPQGATGATGSQGIQGLQGATGPVGPAGATGPIGLTGSTGPAGPIGERGPQGFMGLQGEIGPVGPQGLQGEQGTGISITGSVPSASQLPTSGMIAGDAYIADDTGLLHIYSGTAWGAGVQFVGPEGPSGPQGLQGLQGVEGPVGPTGLTGPEGVAGPQGIAGPIGPQGPIGNTGGSAYSVAVANGFIGTEAEWLATLEGPIGPQGPQGPQGLQGIQGIQGAKGETGAQGPIGLTGATGPEGPQGLTGATGAQGPIGLTGADGPQGIQGVQGPIGPNGQDGTSLEIKGTVDNVTLLPATATDNVAYITADTGHLWIYDGTTQTWVDVGLIRGPQGIQGIQGIQGAIGERGAIGPEGPQGPIGLTGATGDTGAQGIQGIQGLKGDKGDQGIQGIQGVQGSQGIKGDTGLTGQTGPANVLSVGTVTTGAGGSTASASITGTSPSQVLNLTIPAGATKEVYLSQASYDALATKASDTRYYITG